MARKKIKLDNSVGAAVPLSSMIDVVFLLLIYFIFTQKEVVEDVHLQLNLPAPQASSSDEEPPPMLRIDVFDVKDDTEETVHYFVNTSKDGGGRPMEFEELKSYLKLVADTSKETTIVLNCDPNANHNKLIKILDLCNSLDLTELNLLNADFPFVPRK